MTPKTQQGEAPDTERAAFEAWACEQWGRIEGVPDAAWLGWQGRAAAPSPSPAVREALAELVACHDLMPTHDWAVVNRAKASLAAARSALSAPSVPPVEAPSEIPELTAWRNARKASIDAVDAYNAALREARAQDEIKGFGFTNVTREYQAMTEASNAAHRLVGPLLDALYTRASAPVQEGRDTVPWPVVTSYSGGASQEGDGQEVEYAPIGEQP